jgi:hypothetical protein
MLFHAYWRPNRRAKIPCSAGTLAWMIDLASQSLLDATKEAAILQL